MSSGVHTRSTTKKGKAVYETKIHEAVRKQCQKLSETTFSSLDIHFKQSKCGEEWEKRLDKRFKDEFQDRFFYYIQPHPQNAEALTLVICKFAGPDEDDNNLTEMDTDEDDEDNEETPT